MNGSEHALPIAEFAYNAKNASTSYMLLKWNCGYHFCISFKEDCNVMIM